MSAPLYTAATGYDLAAIMSSAWARFYRQANRGTTVADRRKVFAFHLSDAWKHAHNLRDYAEAAAAREEKTAAIVALTPRADRLARAAELDRAAYGIDCADRDGSSMAPAYALRAQAAQLRAAA